MNALEIQKAIRDLRKPLVVAAERLMENPDNVAKLNKTQLSQLIGVCGEATCHEEIANYLRYQAGRKQGWDRKLVDSTIEEISPRIKDLTDEVKVEAWRRFATYLSRAYTYKKAQGDQR